MVVEVGMQREQRPEREPRVDAKGKQNAVAGDQC